MKSPRFWILWKDEIEPAFDLSSMIKYDWVDIGEKTSALPWIQASRNFIKLSKESVQDSKSFELPYNKDGGAVTWDIKYTGDDVNLQAFEPEAISIDVDMKDSFSNNFFKHVFPSVKGHAKLMDKFLSDERLTYYYSVENRRIQFFEEDTDDSDHIIKQCCLLDCCCCNRVRRWSRTFMEERVLWRTKNVLGFC